MQQDLSIPQPLPPTKGIDDTTNIITLGRAWTDAAGNAPTAEVSTANFIVHTKVPELDITSANDGDNIKYTFDFGENVTGFDIGDIDISKDTATVADGATLEGGKNGIYTLLVTPKPNIKGDITVSVVNGLVTDDDGNFNIGDSLTQTIKTINIDNPLEGDDIVNLEESKDVVISGTTTGIENGQTVTVTLHDTANHQNTLEVKATVNNNTWSLIGTQIADISDWKNGDITITAEADGAKQASHTVTLDKTLPNVEISSDIATTTDGTITYTFKFSEPMKDFGKDKLSLTNIESSGDLTYDDQTKTYSITVIPKDGLDNNNKFGVSINDTTIDNSGNPITGETSLNYDYKVYTGTDNNDTSALYASTYDYISLKGGGMIH